MVRSSSFVGVAVGASLVALALPCSAQALPEPIAHSCFALSMDGEGPSVPETIRIDLFVDEQPPADEMPNAWWRPELVIHPLDLPPQEGVWVGLHRPHGLEVVIGDVESGDASIVIFNRVDDRLEGVPASHMRDGELVRGEFTIWAAPITCPDR